MVDNEPMMIINSGRGVTQIILAMATHKLPVEITSKVARSTSGETLARIGKGGRMEQRTGPLGFRVEVTLPNVASLRISGAGNVTYQDINQDELSLDVSGAGTIEVTGKVNRLEADVSGAGDIAAYLLSATHGRLRVSGGQYQGDCYRIRCGPCVGVGKIKIAGNPPQRDTDVSGIGKIKFVDGNCK
jgi:hypothetical protein